MMSFSKRRSWRSGTATRTTIRSIGSSRRRRRARYLIARAAADLVAQRIRAGDGNRLDALADEVLSGRLPVDQAADRILSET